jgi:hypothetical protein
MIRPLIDIIKDKKAERLMLRARVKLHEEGEKQEYFLGLINSKYSRLEFNKETDQEGTTTEKNLIVEKV